LNQQGANVKQSAGFLPALLYDPDDGSSKFLQNVSGLLSNYSPEDSTRHIYRCENFKPTTVF
jgi:hypothetical protein